MQIKNSTWKSLTKSQQLELLSISVLYNNYKFVEVVEKC